ncbi:MAG: GC-type dockerin domain-anchored protein [Phycisphaerales bacterium JB054]
MFNKLAALGLILAAGQAGAQVVYQWDGQTSNLWNEATNWVPNGVPDIPGEEALIAVGGLYTVGINMSPSIDALTVVNPDATVELQGNRNFTIGTGGIVNDGLIQINTGSTFNASIILDQGGTIRGTGRIVLVRSSSDANDARLVQSGAAPVTHAGGHLITGSGRVDGFFVNESEIIADDPAHSLVLAGVFTQIGGGVLRADGTTLELSGATITGGLVESVSGGSVDTVSAGSDFSDVELQGSIGVVGNAVMAVNTPGVLNNGVVSINSNGSTFNATLSVQSDAQFAGSGEIVLNRISADANDARVITENGAVATIGAGQLVRGSGILSGDFVSQAQILADDPAQELLLFGTIDQSAGGTIGADAAAALLGDVTITGGELESTNGGVVHVNPGDVATLSGVTNHGDAGLRGNGRLNIAADGLVNEGTVTVNANDSTFNAEMRFIADAMLNGAGTVVLNQVSADTFDASLTTEDGFTGTLGADQTVSGRGRIDGDFVNNGLVLADQPGFDLIVKGTFDQTSGGVMRADAGFVALDDGQITGGTLEGTGGGAVEVVSGGEMAVDAVTLAGETGVRGNGSLILRGPVTNNGQFTINTNDSTFNATLRAETDATVSGTGAIVMNQPSADTADAMINGNGFTITLAQPVRGNGRLSGTIVAQSEVSPGASAGAFAVHGDLTLEPTATFLVELATLAEFDQLVGPGTVAIDGALEISFIDGYAPVFGDTFAIIDGPDITGAFASLSGPALPGDLVYRVRYDTDEATLLITCPTDTNLDGAVNTLDFLEYLNLWTNGDPEADWNEDGTVNTLDFLAYLNAWTAGC